MKKHITKKIEKIKQRSPDERKKIATYAAGGITLLVVILWLVLISLFGGTREQKKLFNTEELEEIINNVSGEISEVKEEVENKTYNCGNDELDEDIVSVDDTETQESADIKDCDNEEKKLINKDENSHNEKQLN